MHRIGTYLFVEEQENGCVFEHRLVIYASKHTNTRRKHTHTNTHKHTHTHTHTHTFLLRKRKMGVSLNIGLLVISLNNSSDSVIRFLVLSSNRTWKSTLQDWGYQSKDKEPGDRRKAKWKGKWRWWVCYSRVKKRLSVPGCNPPNWLRTECTLHHRNSAS